MCKAIYWDLDGTIVDLYGVDNWEPKLVSHDPSPYQEAAPLHDMEKLNRMMSEFKTLGITIGVISWLAIGSNKEYDKKTRQAKREWLKQHFPCADEIHLVKYDTPKHKVAKIKEKAILIDDNAQVRASWKGKTINPTCEGFMNTLEMLLHTQKTLRNM